MRQIGSIENEPAARLFVDFLKTLGVPAKTDAAGEQWQIWVLDENQIGRAKEELQAFLANPGAERYAEATRKASAARAEEARRQKAAADNLIHVRERWQRPGGMVRPLTLVLMLACVVVSVFTELGEKPGKLGAVLRISPSDGLAGDWGGLAAIRGGEVWRLLTPMFLHFGVFHLVFNVWWLADLGGMIETRRGAGLLLLLVVLLAATSNLAQYYATGPNFGGMSGVNYGLFGYIWMQSRYNPASRMWIHPNSVALMVIWYVICLTGKAGPIANTAHTVGLVFGILLGIVPLAWSRRRG